MKEYSEEHLRAAIMSVLSANNLGLSAKAVARALRKLGFDVRKKDINARLYGDMRFQVTREPSSGKWTTAPQLVSAGATSPASADKQPKTMGARRWSSDELEVLVAVYVSSTPIEGGGMMAQCERLAEELNRSPAAVRRKLKSIGKILEGSTLPEVGDPVADAVYRHQRNPSRSRHVAVLTANRHAWGITDLLA